MTCVFWFETMDLYLIYNLYYIPSSSNFFNIHHRHFLLYIEHIRVQMDLMPLGFLYQSTGGGFIEVNTTQQAKYKQDGSL